MKDLFHYKANEKMVNNRVFWNNVWNVIGLLLIVTTIIMVIGLFGSLKMFIGGF